MCSWHMAKIISNTVTVLWQCIAAVLKECVVSTFTLHNSGGHFSVTEVSAKRISPMLHLMRFRVAEMLPLLILESEFHVVQSNMSEHSLNVAHVLWDILQQLINTLKDVQNPFLFFFESAAWKPRAARSFTKKLEEASCREEICPRTLNKKQNQNRVS